MNILCDFHHSDLWWSHHLIFERGLGHTLFRPRGMEWHTEGYILPNNPDVARQFLEHSMYDFDFAMKHFEKARPRLEKEADDTLWVGMDTINGCPYYPLFRTLTFEEFKDTKIDVLMATVSNHQVPFIELKNKYKPNAKLLREEGNVGGFDHFNQNFPNLMTSDVPTYEKVTASNKVLYHQRFDLGIFYSSPTSYQKRIGSFHPSFRNTPEMVTFAEAHWTQMPEVAFYDYGFTGRNGFCNTKSQLADAMRQVSFVWHVKPIGDGFGHIIHNAFAVGRPVITVGSHYEGRIAGRLLEDEITCIMLNPDKQVENIKKINRNWKKLEDMSRQAFTRFYEVVKYDQELKILEQFIERLE